MGERTAGTAIPLLHNFSRSNVDGIDQKEEHRPEGYRILHGSLQRRERQGDARHRGDTGTDSVGLPPLQVKYFKKMPWRVCTR